MKHLAIIAPFLIAACHHTASTHGMEFAYSKASSIGMYDPKSTSAGTFYLWNTATNRLTLIGEVTLTPGTQTQSRTLTSDNLVGFGISGLPIKESSIVEASLGNQVKTTITNSTRQPYFDAKSALSEFVIGRKQAGATTEDIVDSFRPRNPDYRIVMFTTEERPEEASFRVGSPEGAKNGSILFKVRLPSQDLVTVSSDMVSEATCGSADISSGTYPVCFTDVTVYDPYIQENGNIGWRTDDRFSQAALSQALRDF